MAGRHSQTKLTVASICSGYDKAYALIQGACAKLSAYFLCFLCMVVVYTLILSAGADGYIGAKLQNTFEDNSMAKGKKIEFFKYCLFLRALGNVCSPESWYLTYFKCWCFISVLNDGGKHRQSSVLFQASPRKFLMFSHSSFDLAWPCLTLKSDQHGLEIFLRS